MRFKEAEKIIKKWSLKVKNHNWNYDSVFLYKNEEYYYCAAEYIVKKESKRHLKTYDVNFYCNNLLEIENNLGTRHGCCLIVEKIIYFWREIELR